MAQCKLTPREFIGNAFSPQIGAVCSTIAESVCQKNNLSFIELLQPFCNLNTEGHFKDPQGTTVTVKSLRLSVQDINAQPPEPSVARKMLNDSVSSEPCERSTVVTIGNVDLDVPVCVPWFEAWREMFLAVQFPSDHEFTKHFLACMIVVASGDDNPLEKIQQMATQLHQSVPGKLPKWFNNNALRYYVLIHDAAQDDKAKTEAVFTEMKNLYDPNNCFLLQMNSRPPGQSDDNAHLPDPWSQFLVKHTDFNASSDHSSSPRTPADMGGVAAMPSQVTTETDKSSNAGTPIAPQSAGLLSPDITDKLSLSSEMSEAPSMHVEMGQEAVPVTIHPLSPEGNRSFNLESGTRSFAMTTATRSRMAAAAVTTNNESTPINANVWADSPNHPIAQHGSRLSTQDLDRLRNLISEFCLKSLLPYVEKQIGLLSDVISNKKGVSRSLFSATKRWFGTSKPGVPGSAPTNAVIYTAESPELQLRRLGDLCFMFGHYTLAYQAYHSAKRDFAADQAWLYYAGALEMAALSAFMQGEMTRKTIEYMDDAILTYSNSCKMPQFATRATLLSAECLKGRNLHGEAAKQLIRMTSEDSDLRSALLLEQAAYCFVYPRMIHKYAFHAVLAGHRFSKSGQRRHSLRCYQQAYQVYRDRGWSSAEDHIHFTIGRQAASLKQVGDAVRAFEKLLNESSRQPGPQQAAFLREFLHTHHLLREESTTDRSEIPVLPLPLVDGNEIRVLLGSLPGSSTNDRVPASNVSFESSNDEDDSRWSKLEEAMVIEAQGTTASMIFKPTIVLYTNRTNNGGRPIGIVDEPINVSIELHNPMKISIPLTRVRLLWCFTRGDVTISNETTRDEESRQPVETDILDSVTLQPNSRRRIVLTCTPRRTGALKILGMSYDLSNSPASDQPIVNPMVAVTGKRLFAIKGPRLKNVKEKPGASMYGTDYRLDVNVVERSPLMRITFGKISQEMLCGELQRLEVTLENVGQAPLKNIHVGSTNPRLFCLENNEEKCDAAVTKINLTGESLSPGDRHIVPLWIRAPHDKGNHRLDLLFYWENSDAKSIPKYRLCRHTWQLSVSDSIRISALARRSAVRKSNLPSLTLTVRVKNMNQSHDPFMNEISLERVSLESKAWSLLESVVEPANLNIQPQETYGLLLKLVRKMEGESRFTDLSLTKERQDFDKTVTTFPFINFIQKRTTRLQSATEKFVDTQQVSAEDIGPLAITTRLDATLILRWRAKVTESGTSARHSIGQHHLDLHVINKTYKHPEERRNDQNDYTTRLKIFGPERNVADSTCVVKTRDDVDESECLKNILSFSMSHVREGKHNFDRSRMCIVPVHLHLQNHSQSRIDVKIDTIGTSSQTALPSIKTQLYSPQASTFFRYVGHTAATCHVDPLGVETIKLQAVIASPGTYDVSSRLEISARIANTGDYVLQKWRMESVCSIGHSCV